MVRSWTDEQFIDAFNSSDSIKEALEKLGLKAAGAYNHFRGHAERLNLSLDDLKDRTQLKRINSISKNRIIPSSTEDILKENSKHTTRTARRRILRDNLIEYKCIGCGLTEWVSLFTNGKLIKLVLDLDHINGISTDHRLENLRFLCPNCHSQTPTFKAKNLKRN